MNQKEQVVQSIKSGYNFLEKQDFDGAIKVYPKVHNGYTNLSPTHKEEVRESVEKFYRELAIYVRVNEAYLLAKQGDLSGLRRELLAIHNNAFDLSTEEPTQDVLATIAYAEEKYKFFLTVYNYRVKTEAFKQKFKEVKSLLEKRELDQAVKSYAELILIGHKLMKYLKQDERTNVYYQAKELIKPLSIQALFQRSTHKPTAKEKQQKNKIEHAYEKAKRELDTLKRIIEHGRHHHIYDQAKP